MLKFNPVTAQLYLRKLLKAPPTQQQELQVNIAAQRFAARQVLARGLTQGTTKEVTVNTTIDEVLPADPRRRLIVFGTRGGNIRVWPDATFDPAVGGILLGAGVSPLAITEETYGVFVQYPWFATDAAGGVLLGMMTEVYLT